MISKEVNDARHQRHFRKNKFKFEAFCFLEKGTNIETCAHLIFKFRIKL